MFPTADVAPVTLTVVAPLSEIVPAEVSDPVWEYAPEAL
jgi:hypothetical protein